MTWTVKWFTKCGTKLKSHFEGSWGSLSRVPEVHECRCETFFNPYWTFYQKKTWNLFPFYICNSIITRLLHMIKSKLFSTILLNNLGYHFRWLWWPATTFVRTSGACRIPVASPWLVNDIKIWKEVKKMGVSITMMETIYHYDGNSVENGFLSQWLK